MAIMALARHITTRCTQDTMKHNEMAGAHSKLNLAFTVIQGYSYLCRQESRTVYCRNVQLMPTLFLKVTKANSSISTTPLGFEDVPARNAFE